METFDSLYSCLYYYTPIDQETQTRQRLFNREGVAQCEPEQQDEIVRVPNQSIMRFSAVGFALV